MKDIFRKHLFEKRIFVQLNLKSDYEAFETVYALAKIFNIHVIQGEEFADKEMISLAEKWLGIKVPAPFYQGFPDSVRELSADQLFYDQMIHYVRTYGFGNFSNQGHSVMEELAWRTSFEEKEEVKEFRIVNETEAMQQLKEDVKSLLMSSRPLSEEQYAFVLAFIETYSYKIEECASKNTIVRLLVDLRDVSLADLLKMSDVIKLVEEINYRLYENVNVKKLNLKNKDRKLITAVINRLFKSESCDIRTCYEKKAIWCGLLHHLHYKPVNELAVQFVGCMRGKGNESVYAAFEKAMAQKDIRDALMVLHDGKGGAAVLRNLNYILSRAESKEDVQFVLEHIDSNNGIVLLQLFMQYAIATTDKRERVFRFTKYNMLKVHAENLREIRKRKSIISEELRDEMSVWLREKLEKVYEGKLSKVYIDPRMKNIALPLQENTSAGGFGVLPKGSKLQIPEGKKIRAFTYWEKVDDIDLSVIGIRSDGRCVEFSWRTMCNQQSKAITYSGDQTAGYNGGSEYFDINIPLIRECYPDVEYMIFCDNVYSGSPFSHCVCRAGYMLRDEMDSGEVFEPKTVKTSFTINCESTFAYLFGIQMETNEFVWLNMGKNSQQQVAGNTNLSFLTDYFNVTSVLNVYSFFEMLATEVVEDPMEADLIVSDEDFEHREEVQYIRSYDIDKMMEYMNVR